MPSPSWCKHKAFPIEAALSRTWACIEYHKGYVKSQMQLWFLSDNPLLWVDKYTEATETISVVLRLFIEKVKVT